MTLRLSASKRALWLHCQYWARDDVPLTDTGPKEARNLGLAFHDANEAQQAGHAVDVDAIAARRHLSPEQRADFELLRETWIAKNLVPKNAKTEVTFAFDTRPDDERGSGPESRRLGERLDRKYEAAGLRPWEIPGTVDLIWWVREEGKLIAVIPDIKTGAQIGLENAAFNEQALFNGMAAVLSRGADVARVQVWHVTPDDILCTSWDMDREEIELKAREVRAELSAFRASPPEPRPGLHCGGMWCPAVLSCPKARTVAVEPLSATQLVPVHRLRGPIASADEASYRLQHLSALKAFLKEYEEDVKTWAEDHGGIDLPEGSWGPIQQTTEFIEANSDAFGTIEELLGEDGVRTAVDMKISKASIERAVKEKGMRPIAKSVEAVVEGLRAVGAVGKGKKTVWGVRKGSAA